MAGQNDMVLKVHPCGQSTDFVFEMAARDVCQYSNTPYNTICHVIRFTIIKHMVKIFHGYRQSSTDSMLLSLKLIEINKM